MLITIDDLRGTDFAHSYHWDVMFPSYGGAVFPAHGLTAPVARFENGSIDYGAVELHFPEKVAYSEISLELYETVSWDVLKWLREWRNDIVDNNNFTVGLVGQQNVARQMIIMEQNGQKSVVNMDKLLVIPSSDVQAVLSSDKNGLVSISVAFSIVGFA